MKKTGFKHNGRTIFYMDQKGKDISFERWRVCLYYAPHYAATHFEPTAEAYNKFISGNVLNTYEDYGQFRTDAEREGLRDNY
jgi:hypothetical protein